jgi:hypothetical protein
MAGSVYLPVKHPSSVMALAPSGTRGVGERDGPWLLQSWASISISVATRTWQWARASR